MTNDEIMGGALAEAVRAAVAAERARREAAEASATRSSDAAVDAVRELGHVAAAAVTRADAAEAEVVRMRECLARANCALEATERARYAAEDERDEARAAVAAERARCAAVCREVAAQHWATGVGGAAECAEAIERGPVTP